MQDVVFEETGSRYLILGDANQEFPTGPLRVTAAEMVEGSKGPYPLLTLQDATGNDFRCAAFSRDVRRCVSEWGKRPTDWQFVTFAQAKGSSRRELVPCDPQPQINEQRIVA